MTGSVEVIVECTVCTRRFVADADSLPAYCEGEGIPHDKALCFTVRTTEGRT